MQQGRDPSLRWWGARGGEWGALRGTPWDPGGGGSSTKSEIRQGGTKSEIRVSEIRQGGTVDHCGRMWGAARA